MCVCVCLCIYVCDYHGVHMRDRRQLLGFNFFLLYRTYRGEETGEERREKRNRGKERRGKEGEPRAENSGTFESFCSLVYEDRTPKNKWFIKNRNWPFQVLGAGNFSIKVLASCLEFLSMVMTTWQRIHSAWSCFYQVLNHIQKRKASMVQMPHKHSTSYWFLISNTYTSRGHTCHREALCSSHAWEHISKYTVAILREEGNDKPKDYYLARISLYMWDTEAWMRKILDWLNSRNLRNIIINHTK